MLDEGNEYRFNVAAAASCSYPSSYLPLDPELALTGPAPLASGDDVAARYMPSMSDVASHTPQQASHCAQCQDSEIFGSATGSGLLSDAGPWTPCSPIPLDLTDGNETGSWAKIRPEASETQDPLRLDVSSLQRVIDPSLLSDTRLERWPDGVKPVNAFGPWVGEQADGLAHQHAEGPPCASQEYPEMSAPLPEMFPDQVDYDAYAADDEEIWGTAMEAEDETVAGQPPTPALDHSGVQCVGQDDQVPDPGGIQPAGRGQFRLGQRPDAKDRFLVQAKRAGMPYREIRARGNFTEAESTLRGRFRALTKAKEYRVRKPEWQPHDVRWARFHLLVSSRLMWEMDSCIFSATAWHSSVGQQDRNRQLATMSATPRRSRGRRSRTTSSPTVARTASGTRHVGKCGTNSRTAATDGAVVRA